MGLDLILIEPTAEPPVAKAMDYGQWEYENKKKQHEAKKRLQLITSPHRSAADRSRRSVFEPPVCGHFLVCGVTGKVATLTGNAQIALLGPWRAACGT